MVRNGVGIVIKKTVVVVLPKILVCSVVNQRLGLVKWTWTVYGKDAGVKRATMYLTTEESNTMRCVVVCCGVL